MTGANYHLPNEHHPGPRCDCEDCNMQYPDADFAPNGASDIAALPDVFASWRDAIALDIVNELPDAFSLAMARVEELREAKRADLARRDRAEWECFFHFACENALLKRQAE